MANPLAIVLHPMGLEKLPGVGEPVDVGADRTIAELLLHIAGYTGGTLELWVETSFTGTGDWMEVAHVEKTSNITGEEVFAINCERFMRCRWDVKGGPPNTVGASFQLAGTQHQTYVDSYDMKQAMPENMFNVTPPGILARAAIQATDEAASYLGEYYSMPLSSWSHALRLHVGKMAFYHVMMRRGYNPDNIDQTIRQGYLDALAWLQGPAANGAGVGGIIDATPDQSDTGAYMISDLPRGWMPPI